MNDSSAPSLQRTLGFWSLLAYGVGDMLGAGIYALVGKVAGVSGTLAWVSFGIAMVAATLTAAVYGELATRYPKSGGAAYYCDIAFRKPALSIVVGWLVFCSGLVSLATSSRAFSGYLIELAPWAPQPLIIFAFLCAVGIVNVRGIRESSTTNIICTSVELTGLLLVIVTGAVFVFGSSSATTVPVAAAQPIGLAPLLLLQGAGLAFFAFVGFEDMANVAEEVNSPERTFPRALLAAMGIVGLCYMSIVYLATSVIPPETLAASNAPLLTVFQTTAPWAPSRLFTGIALFAVANTGLLNCIMASRLIYGMSREGLLPAWFKEIHPTRHTPHRAGAVVVGIALILALTGTVTHLASTTSMLLLIVFTVVSIALIVIKRREGSASHGFRVPIAVPVAAIAICVTLAAFTQRSSLAAAGVLALVGVVIATQHRRLSGTK